MASFQADRKHVALLRLHANNTIILLFFLLIHKMDRPID